MADRKTALLVALVLAALVLAGGLLANDYILFVISKTMVFVIMCLGLNILAGYSGQLAFAQAAMCGIGAYVTGLLQVRLGLPFLPSAVAGIAATTVIGAVLTLPALRLSGLYLALSTLSFALAVQWVFLRWDWVTYGAGGFRAPAFTLGFGLGQSRSAFLLILAVTVALVLAGANLVRSKYGRCFVAIRENQVAAASAGIDVTRTKLIAFTVSAFYAGVAGALFVPLVGYITPESFNLDQMILLKIMIVVGGLGSIFGSVIGPVMLVCLVEVLRDAPGLTEVLFGGALLGFVLYRPGGVASMLGVVSSFRDRRRADPLTEDAAR